MAKKFEVFELVIEDLKDLMEFFQLEPEDDKYSIDRKLNSEDKPTALFFIPEGETGVFREKKDDDKKSEKKSDDSGSGSDSDKSGSGSGDGSDKDDGDGDGDGDD